MSDDVEEGISYAKAIPVAALDADLNLLDDDDDDLADDDSPESTDEAGLTEDDAVLVSAGAVQFESDESGVAR